MCMCIYGINIRVDEAGNEPVYLSTQRGALHYNFYVYMYLCIYTSGKSWE